MAEQARTKAVRKAPAKRRGKAEPAAAPAAAEARPLRGRIPALPVAHAGALRSFFSRQHSWLLNDNGLLQFLPGRPAEADQTFELDAEGVRMGLRLQATAVAVGDGLHWSDFQGRSRILAWSLAHEPHLMRLSEALGVALAPLLDAAAPEAEAADPPMWLEFLIDDEHPDDPDAGRRPPPTQGSLRLPASWLERLLTRAEPPFEGQAPDPLGHWARLPASVSLLLPVPPLSPQEWAGLNPGDVIVVGRSIRPPAFQARACGRLWPVVPASGGWRVEGAAQHIPRMQEAEPMTENDSRTPDEAGNPQPAAPDPDAAARELPVELSFEVGRTEMALGEIARLQPGYVFQIPSQLEGANVTVRANGQPVGQGELVSVGDTLGVRLLSWK